MKIVPEFGNQNQNLTTDILAFNEGQVFTYFTQKFDLSEMTRSDLDSFLNDVNDMNPMSEFIIPPEKQPHECCEIVIVSGDGIDGYIGDGMFERQE